MKSRTFIETCLGVMCQSLLILAATLASAQTPPPPCITDDRDRRSAAVHDRQGHGDRTRVTDIKRLGIDKRI